jgi:ribosome biogenesis GTPase
MIVAAPEPVLEPFLIDKYTVAAELANATPVLVINKADLLDAAARRELDSRLADYVDSGYAVVYTSARQNRGLEQLAERLTGKTSILVGQSGVGKSSLVKRLLPELDIAIGRLSAASGQGRHTTTTTTLYHLPHGGDLIDSPGVRDFHLGQVDPDALAAGFREFRPHLGHCRFNNCRHVSEPDCAVIAAAGKGAISPRRLESYRRLLASGP